MLPRSSDVRFCIDAIMRARVQKMLKRSLYWGMGLLMGGCIAFALNIFRAHAFFIYANGVFLSLVAFLFILDLCSFVFKMFVKLRFERVYCELSLLCQRFLVSPHLSDISDASPKVLLESFEQQRRFPHVVNSVGEEFWKQLCVNYCLAHGVPLRFFESSNALAPPSLLDEP